MRMTPLGCSFRFAGFLVAVSTLEAATDTPSHPGREDTYTLTSVMELANPVDPAVMNDDFQEARVLRQDARSATIEVTYYPLTHQRVGETVHWRDEDAAMQDYLKPTPTENWDEAMRRDLVSQLRADGIDPDVLTDRELVEQVARWAFRRARSTQAFGIWAVHFPDGKPTVLPELRGAFDHEKPTPDWSDQQMFDQEVLGRAMFYQRIHGACTSSSIYLTTILRALGIPTRIVICVPPFDPNDAKQAALFYDNVHHNHVRETVRAALDGTHGFVDHFFNEVYVGHHWVRLNYSNLGQPILDRHYFGLLTHIYTAADLSRVPLAETWGRRYFAHVRDPELSSVNPYRLVSVSDHFGANANLPNPEEHAPELKTVTISAILRPTAVGVPEWVRQGMAKNRQPTLLLVTKDWVTGATNPMRSFLGHASHKLWFAADNHEDVPVQLNGSVSSGNGEFQAFVATLPRAAQAKVVPGVRYTLKVENTSDTYRWQPSANLPAIELAPSGAAER